MSTYRDDKRKDDALRAEQAREDRRLEVEAQLRAREVKAEQKRADEAARQEREQKAAEARRRQELADQRVREAKKAAKKAAAAAKRARLTSWVKTNPATLFVGFVMVASIVPAVISQVGALSGAKVPVVLAGLLAAMLEGGAWAITFMGRDAEVSGREPRKYRLGTWLTASAAAVVNLWHGLQEYPGSPWVAFVLGGSSLFAIYIWDLKTHGSHGKTRAEKREEKARQEHLAKRRKHHKDIATEAEKLTAALPYGAITEEDAFAAAWRIHRGAEPGLSGELYAAATASKVQLGAAFELGEHVRPELLRTGMLAAALDPFGTRPAGGVPTLGPLSVLGTSQGATTQAGIGLYGSEPPTRKAPHTTPEGAAPQALPRQSEKDLSKLLPAAHKAANELVAEGKPISAAALSRRLQIRREDAVKLRDLVIEDRKLHAV